MVGQWLDATRPKQGRKIISPTRCYTPIHQCEPAQAVQHGGIAGRDTVDRHLLSAEFQEREPQIARR